MKKTILLALCLLSAATINHVRGQENWTQFRGPNAQGISRATDLPVHWSTEENIAWKTEIPGESWSSPIAWNDHIFVTTATENGKNCHIIALDRQTGHIRWNKIPFTQEAGQHRHDMNSYATPTPVTDGTTVYAVFSGGSIAALDFEGNTRWTNTQLRFYSHHGLGTSPILYQDLLILSVNPSNHEEPKNLGWLDPWDKSYLLALDKNTGQERWRGHRGQSRIAHSTPVLMKVNGKDQLITTAGDVIQGFDPMNGQLLWTVASQGEPCVPTPVLGDGLVYSSPTNSSPIRAVRPDGQGECTATHLVWEQKGYTPLMSSYLYIHPHLYTCPDNRSFTCLDGATGEFRWQLPLRSGAINASPVYADGKIYLLSEQGITTVLQLSDDPQTLPTILATNPLKERCRASMAIAGKQLLIRSESHLWCIGP
jgi:outer membrane protein assembly factor BamB